MLCVSRVASLALLLSLSIGHGDAITQKVVSSSESVKLICVFNVAVASVAKVEWVKTGVGRVAAMDAVDGRIQSVTFGHNLRGRATMTPHILEISSVKDEDSGEYMCAVETNDHVPVRHWPSIYLNVAEVAAAAPAPKSIDIL